MSLLRVVRGFTSARCFLSCTADEAKVDLWNVDDGSERQQGLLQ